jgi:hypothetical protein
MNAPVGLAFGPEPEDDNNDGDDNPGR